MSQRKSINIIVATSTNYGIGYDNKMCWHIPEELQNFRKITTEVIDKNKKNCVIMGKNTWYSLPNGALKNRFNIILTQTDYSKVECEACSDNVCVMNNLDSAIEYIEKADDVESVFIIGGAHLYNECLTNIKYVHKIDKIYLSIVYDQDYICDKFIDSDSIYKHFRFEKENIHFMERYVFMIGNNKLRVVEEPVL